MNYKLNFTEEQVKSIIKACEWAINDDFPASDPINSHYQRIINKFEKSLVEKQIKK